MTLPFTFPRGEGCCRTITDNTIYKKGLIIQPLWCRILYVKLCKLPEYGLGMEVIL